METWNTSGEVTHHYSENSVTEHFQFNNTSAGIAITNIQEKRGIYKKCTFFKDKNCFQ